MARHTYSSAAAGGQPQQEGTTEGIEFDLDGVSFTCHGWLSAYDLSEFAGPADDGQLDDGPQGVGSLRVLADFLRQLLGEATYRAFTRHRRAHRTPDAVVQQIVQDIVEETAERATGRPTPRPSTSPSGPAPTAVSSTATSPSPDLAPAPYTITGPSRQPPAIPLEVAQAGDLRFVPEPGTGNSGPEAPAGTRIHKVINLGDISRTRVDVEPLTG